MPRSKARRIAELKSSLWISGRSAVSTIWMRMVRGSCNSRLASAILKVDLPRVRMPTSSAGPGAGAGGGTGCGVSNVVPSGDQVGRRAGIPSPYATARSRPGGGVFYNSKPGGALSSRGGRAELDIEQDIHHIAVLDHVGLALHA